MNIRDLKKLIDADPKSEVHILTETSEDYGWPCEFENRVTGRLCTTQATAYWESTECKSKHNFCTRHILNPSNGAIY